MKSWNAFVLFGLAVVSVCAAGCAPRSSVLAEAGYYEPREQQIRAECEREVYGVGRQIGPYLVRSGKEYGEAVEKIIKSRRFALADGTPGVKIDYGRADQDVAAISQEMKTCELAKGSKVTQRLDEIMQGK